MTLTQGKAILSHALANRDRAGEAIVVVGGWLLAGAPGVAPAVLAARESECATCDARQPMPGNPSLHYCAECKCPDWKLHLPSAKCKRGRWPA